MEQSPPGEGNTHSLTHSPNQEISYLLWNLKVHYCVHERPSLVPVLSQMHPVQIPTLFP